MILSQPKEFFKVSLALALRSAPRQLYVSPKHTVAVSTGAFTTAGKTVKFTIAVLSQPFAATKVSVIVLLAV